MRKPPIGGKPKREKPPALQAMVCGGRVLVFYDSLLRAIDIDPETEPDRPKTVSIKRAQQLTGLSLPTIERMIRAGRQAQAENQNTAAA